MITKSEMHTLEFYGAILGKTVRSVRILKPEELEALGWANTSEPAVEIIMTDGTVIIPSSDSEGNGAGHLIIWTEHYE